MLLFLNPTIKTQWKVWLFIQTFHCVFQHIHRRSSSFSALWIYTILKPFLIRPALWAVSLPYGFTLFSNKLSSVTLFELVSLPYGFTLFSNFRVPSSYHFCVSLPYGFTLFSNQILFYTHFIISFTTLWIYTILKPSNRSCSAQIGFTTLWIYTILKPLHPRFNRHISFTTLWIYTILKLHFTFDL